VAIWCIQTDRWSLEDWRTPMQLQGDPLEIYARVQAASEDLSQPLRGFASLPRLAAPAGADWSRYPVSDRVVFTFLGWLARGLGVFATVNLAMAAVHALGALAFYLCARFLRWRREWAFATALLFTFANYNFRWSVTVSFSLTFAIPPLLLLCGWIARSAPAVAARGWMWLAAGLGLWFGGGNPYLGFFAAQLVGWAVILQIGRRREPARWRAGAVFLGLLAGSFLLHHAAYFLAPTGGGSRLTLARSYTGAEIYALKLTDLVISPADHLWGTLARIGRAYQAQSALRTEFFVNYLGVAGVIGLALLLWAGLRAALRSRARRIPDAVLGLGWTLLFSAVGGLNSLLALAGLDIFRASNRNSVFILVWALWFFGRWCQRHWQPRSLALRYALPLAIVVVGLFDSLPRMSAARALRDHAATLRHYRALTHDLETRLGPNAKIFQLPAPPFPEAGTIATMGDYEHFLPYLTSDNLRFSYGALRGTALARSLSALGHLPTPALKDRLEALGFSAIWIDRRGLPDAGSAILGELRSLGLTEFGQSELPQIAVVLLRPAPNPRPLDLDDPALFEPWDAAQPQTELRLTVLEGWFDAEHSGSRSWRWAQESAGACIALPAAGTVQLSFSARSLRRGNLTLELDGREIWRRPIGPQSRERQSLLLPLTAGPHRLTWRFDGPLEYPATFDSRKIGFAVENPELTPVPDAASGH
jgi:hypothetical protein